MMKKIVTAFALAAVPSFALAQANAFGILGTISNLMRIIIPLLITAALIYFIYGVIKFVIAKTGDDKGEAKDIVVRGIIGFFVILSIWGLVGIIQSTFNIGSGGEVGRDNIPGVNLN